MKRVFMILAAMVTAACVAYGCTSAIISGRVTWNGKPLLWKHRDTSRQDNKVERIAATDSTYEYVALFNADDTGCREAWMGYNSQGFAVMNTAVYNLKDDTVSLVDMEGVVMTAALRSCVTVDDFERLLQSWPYPIGVEANFGVIDAAGNGAYFETCNSGYTKYDLADAQDGVIVRTNYAHSGRKGEGRGYLREKNALHMLAPHIAARDVSAELLTESLSRTFYRQDVDTDFSYSGKKLLADNVFIPRYTSTATVVIEGITPGESPMLTTMWVGLGYPPCTEVRAAWLGDDGVPHELRGTGPDGHAPMCDSALVRKREVHGSDRMVDLSKLYNNAGTGYCQVLSARSKATYKRGYEILDSKRKSWSNGKR